MRFPWAAFYLISRTHNRPDEHPMTWSTAPLFIKLYCVSVLCILASMSVIVGTVFFVLIGPASTFLFALLGGVILLCRFLPQPRH